MSQEFQEKFNTRQSKQRKGYRDQLKPSGRTVKYNVQEGNLENTSTVASLGNRAVSLDKKKRWEVFTKQNPDIIVLNDYTTRQASNRIGDRKRHNEAQIVKEKKEKKEKEKQMELEEEPVDPNQKFNERKARREANRERRRAAKNQSDEQLSSGSEADKEVFVITSNIPSASEFPLFATEKSGRYSPEYALGIEKNHWTKKRRRTKQAML